ncbi:MAG: DUF1501 domain-containing protein [Bacteroidia bacterium]|nr:DUF1501 domain-containing protein [Bacteroidia bacterium]
MKRRDFLKISAPLSITPFILNGLTMKAFATPGMLQTLGCEEVGDRVMVLVQLKGGNDGINTLIPIEQYATYANLRPDIRIKDTGASGEKYITLDNGLALPKQTGLHPAMTSIKDLYDQGKAAMINGVGYPDANKSHFKSTDLWLTGGDGTPANFTHSTGWMGRYLDYSFPGIAGNPNTAMPDPLGIELGDKKPSLGFHTESEHQASINLTGQDPSGFYNVVSEIGNSPLLNLAMSEYGGIMEHVMNIENSISVYSKRISDVFDAGNNVGSYPNSDLANQLKTVARLMSGGCKTKIFLVSLGGFDTHNGQIQTGSTELGKHAELLGTLADAVKAFQDDLQSLGLEDRVMTVTFSEFGRKAIQNGSNGTDHGTLAPMMVFGKHLEAGVFGNHIDLNNLDNTGAPADAPVHDYRQVFTTLLQDWLGASNAALTAAYFDPYATAKLPMVAPSHVVPSECFDPFINAVGIEDELFQFRAFPNPTIGLFRVEYVLVYPTVVNITVMDLNGSVVLRKEQQSLAGQNQLVLDISSQPAGVYLCEIAHATAKQVIKIVRV